MKKNSIHPTQIDNVKSKIIVSVLDFIENGNIEDKTKAIEYIKVFAQFYNIPLNRNSTVSDNKKHLRQFILNDKGYQFSLINLYNSLVKCEPYADKQAINRQGYQIPK